MRLHRLRRHDRPHMATDFAKWYRITPNARADVDNGPFGSEVRQNFLKNRGVLGVSTVLTGTQAFHHAAHRLLGYGDSIPTDLFAHPYCRNALTTDFLLLLIQIKRAAIREVLNQTRRNTSP